MIVVAATGRVVNPKESEKVFNFAIEDEKPDNTKELIGVTIFISTRTEKVIKYITHGRMISIGGRLEISTYNGKKQYRILASDIQLLSNSNVNAEKKPAPKPVEEAEPATEEMPPYL